MALNLALFLALVVLGSAFYQSVLHYRKPTYEFLGKVNPISPPVSSAHLLSSLEPVPPDVPIEYQRVRFNATVPGTRDTEWLGSSNEKTDALWDSLLDVGVIALNAAQISHLSPPPARLADGQDGWAGTFEVFHQVHCLNLLRKRFFAPERNGPADWQETADLWEWHNEHCFEYLRQTILCHADVSIFPLEYDAKHEVYVPRPSAEKRCRNWEVIHEYAREHMATDIRKGVHH
ncbi:hypothetical protein VTI74DRAFT_7185 [Chaetomium olivicolor]